MKLTKILLFILTLFAALDLNAAQQAPKEIKDLPDKTLVQILGYLGPQSAARATQVCKKWMYIIHPEKLFQKLQDLEFMHDLDSKAIVSLMASNQVLQKQLQACVHGQQRQPVAQNKTQNATAMLGFLLSPVYASIYGTLSNLLGSSELAGCLMLLSHMVVTSIPQLKSQPFVRSFVNHGAYQAASLGISSGLTNLGIPAASVLAMVLTMIVYSKCILP